MSTNDKEFALLTQPMFVDFFRTLDIQRSTALAGCPIDLDVMHKLSEQVISDLSHGDSIMEGLNQISPWFQGYLDRRLVMMLNTNQTECPFCEKDFSIEGVKLSRLPFGSLPSWLKSNIVCRRCLKTCRKLALPQG